MEPEKQALLSAVLDNAVDAVVTVDENGTIEVINPATERMFGYAGRDLIGQGIQMLLPQADDDQSAVLFQSFVGDGTLDAKGTRHEIEGLRKDGTTFPIHLAVSEFQAGDRRLFTGVVRDISDLRQRQGQLEAILNNAVDAIITINERGIVQSMNPATQKLFGYSDSEVVGNNISMLMPRPYREEHDGYLENYHRTRVPKIIGRGREVVGQRKDGTTFPMHLAVSEITVGDLKLFTGIVRDISDLKEAEAELKKLNDDLESRVKERTRELQEAQAELLQKEKLATLGQVSGGIAHEIRNPLNAVKTSAYYLLNAKNPTEAKTKEHLERIDRQVTLIDNVVTALFDVARMPEPKRTPVDLHAILKAVVRGVSLPDSIEASINSPADNVMALADENQLPIVFKNLVRNARDAMEAEGGQLDVSIEEEEDKVIVSVRDTGCGIADEELQRITEPLYSTKARGMGLGLAITMAIVEKNAGELQIESELGVGSKFSVVLDRATEN